MLNRISLFTAACMAATTGLFVANNAVADDTTITKETTVTHVDANAANATAKLPAGITQGNFNADKGIDKAFKAITEDSMSKTGFDNLVAKLVDQDRDRIKKSVASGKSLTNMDGNNNKQLADLIDQLNASFKSKFNHKFDIDIDKVYMQGGFANFLTGEVTDPNLLVGKWPVDANLMETAGMNNAAGGKLTQADADQAKNKAFGGDVNLEKGRKVAIAHIMPSHGMSGLNASLISENLVGWKFDVPNNLTAERLYSNLTSNLSYLNQHKADWPSDVNDTYRAFTHAVTASLYDVNFSNAGTAQSPLNNGVRPADNTANNR